MTTVNHGNHGNHGNLIVHFVLFIHFVYVVHIGLFVHFDSIVYFGFLVHFIYFCAGSRVGLAQLASFVHLLWSPAPPPGQRVNGSTERALGKPAGHPSNSDA